MDENDSLPLLLECPCFSFIYVRNCDHKDMNIPQLNVLYKFSPTQVSKNHFSFIRMSCNHKKMLV